MTNGRGVTLGENHKVECFVRPDGYLWVFTRLGAEGPVETVIAVSPEAFGAMLAIAAHMPAVTQIALAAGEAEAEK